MLKHYDSTVGIKNKNLIIPTEDLRPNTSFGPNDIEVNFGLLSKKAKR